MRTLARNAIAGLVAGVVLLGTAWAGVGVAPPPEPADRLADWRSARSGEPAAEWRSALPVAPAREAVDARGDSRSTGPSGAEAPFSLPTLGNADVLAGAAKVSIYPQPDEDAGQRWEIEGCETLGDDLGPATVEHLLDVGDVTTSPWPRNPDCIYSGGYDIGPMNAITAFEEEHGLWARTVAFSDGEDIVALTLLDAVGYFGTYEELCDDCGMFDLQEQLGEELGVDPAGLIFSSTHSHTGPDFLGAWGGVPDWYIEQVAEAMRTSVREAVADLRPAQLRAGETLAREQNRERRNHYYSPEEQTFGWLQALEVTPGGEPRPGDAIATVGIYAAHPINADVGVADADWNGRFATAAQERFGGVGLAFPSGLGNMSTRGGLDIGYQLADMIPDDGGEVIEVGGAGAITAEQRFWDQPVSNAAVSLLGFGGLIYRDFTPVPATVTAGKDDVRPCVGTGPGHVRTAVTAAKVGPVLVTGVPGEAFANLSNTVRTRYATWHRHAPEGRYALPISLANDMLGYLIQSFEDDRVGPVGGPPPLEYEELFGVDTCMGDKVLDEILDAAEGLG